MYFRLQLIRMTRKLRARRYLGFMAVGAVLAVCVLLNAVCFWYFDRNAHGEEPLDFGSAVWYSVISITTIGYGDYSATTPGARLSTALFIVLIGLSAFSVFFGMIVDAVNDAAGRGLKGLTNVLAKDHALIVNFPSESRVRQVIDEIRSDPEHANDEIVIVTDQIDELPFRLENVMFVRGSAHDAETYRRASAQHCRLAIVLSKSYDDPNSDAVVAAAVSVIDSIDTNIHIVAECLNEKHRELFKAVRCDAIVSGLRMAGNLLVQEVHDPGISRVMEVLTSNLEGDTLYSTLAERAGVDYTAMAGRLLDRGVNMLAVNRSDRVLTTFRGESSEPGDRVIYVAPKRMAPGELFAGS
ncbi:MAG: hypothetical protein CMJ31_04660 [Phycisphaerae bacterium]|nr:hypothetical protein [Phycisphaerae bacterium]